MNPELNATLYAAWREFMDHAKLDEGLVRREVSESWKRCRAAGLDPAAPKAPVRLHPSELAALRAKNQVLLDVALPTMKFLQTAVKGSGCLLVMTDPDGLVLEAFGDEPLLKMAADNNYVPGCCRAESEVGTNAIGLAIMERKPVQLTGAEHYNVRHHRWTCASAPVLGAEGALIGTVTLSGESVASHPHTLGMVIAAAEAISRRLEHRLVEIKKNRATRLVASVLTSVAEGIIVVDGEGLVSNVNPEAARLLSASPDESIGVPVNRLLPGAPELDAVIREGRSSGPIEIRLDRKSGASVLFVSPYPLRDESESAGAILMLSERRAFVQSVRKISGTHAHFTFEHIIGQNEALLRQLDLAKTAARQDCRVLISGETGTGKELVAQAIHNGSSRRNAPFVAINCAAIPRELLESELMGYRDGAFSGARKGGQMGKLELADGGTVFLDEISQMPLDLQSKLLRVLQDSIVTRLGDTGSTKVDIRIIAATNEDLFAKSKQGGFRQDLYFRLSVVEVNLPALRERADDISVLANHVLSQIAARCDRNGLEISEAAMEMLCLYDWPGNVRELENVIEMAVILCDRPPIEPRHLHARLRAPRGEAPRRVGAAEAPQPIKELEADLLKATMKELHGNVALVSRALGISRATIYRRMKQLGIRRSVDVG